MIKKTKTMLSVSILLCCFAWAAPSAESLKTTIDDRQSVEVTVYANGSRGLIKELRNVTLPAGRGELQFMDVASRIVPTTVHVRPLTYAEDFVILEQNYEYDLISYDRLMEKYIGKDIQIIEFSDYRDSRRVVDAMLMSRNDGDEVFKINDAIYLGHPGIRVVPKIPGNLISRPTLSWIYRNRIAREYQLEVTYMTGGMHWSADYVLFLDESGEGGSELAGWVTLENQSGASYEDARMTLVAGTTRDGLYVYDLADPTTIKHNQTKQVRLMEAQGLAVEKEYLVTSLLIRGRERVDGAARQRVMTYLRFRNTKDNNLGDPLPSGKVMIYTADESGRRQFIGGDSIAHIPRDENIRLRAGEAFDIVAERTQISHQLRRPNGAETEWMIALRNRKNDEDVTVRVQENTFSGQWEIRQSTHRYTRVDARTLRFDVTVASGQEVIIRYTIRTE